MLKHPSRLQTIFLMMPAWAFVHALLVFRILPYRIGLREGYWPILPWGNLSTSLTLTFLALAFIASFMAFRRARTLGWKRPLVTALLIHLPFVGAGLALWLAATGEEAEQRAADPTAIAGRLFMPLVLASTFAVLLTAGAGEAADRLFGLRQAGGYFSGYFGWAVFIGLPFAIGVSGGVAVRRAGGGPGQAAGAASILIGAVLLLLCGAALEGIVCVVMAAPIGGLLALLGAAVGFTLTRGPVHDGRLQSAAWLAVVAMVAVEGWQPPAPLEASTTTEIIIEAPVERVWAELHDIRDLPAPDDFLFRFGVAHPVGTVTSGRGVGAERLCKLSTGDMPEIITVWKPAEELRFQVLATPPSMRELGFFGRTIDAEHLHSAYASLEGGFKLEALPGGRTRLTGDSRYLLNLAPAPYWNLWTEDIVHRVHRRVMEHVKSRAESRPRA